MTKEIKITFSIAAIVIIGLVLLMAFSPKQSPTSSAIVDQSSLVASSSHMTGKLGAKVTIVEFGDYECPACGYAAPIVKQLIDIYGKDPDFNFVFRNFPLSSIHPNAMIGAEAAEAAAAQGKFWQMNELLYEKQDEWAGSSTPIDLLVGYAKQLGLDTARFKKEVSSNAYEKLILSDEDDGNRLGVAWTPTFYINGVLQQQTPTLDGFKSQIDAVLKK